MKKLGILILFFTGLALLFFTTPQRQPTNSPIEQITMLWNKDLDYLRTVKGFPKLEEIREVNFVPGNRLARFWLYKTNPNLNFSNPKGKYLLEVTLMAWAQNTERSLVIQYELFEGKKRNKAWEFARTLVF